MPWPSAAVASIARSARRRASTRPTRRTGGRRMTHEETRARAIERLDELLAEVVRSVEERIRERGGTPEEVAAVVEWQRAECDKFRRRLIADMDAMLVSGELLQ